MKRSLIITVLAVVICAMTVNGRQLSPDQALQNAGMSAQKIHPRVLAGGNNSAPLMLKYTATDRTENTVYVFSRGENGGFVVVAADDVAPEPLLGYADSGSFDAVNMPEGMRWWLEEQSAEIAAFIDAGRTPLTEEEATDTRESIEPIVKTEWNQTAPYNDYCPVVNGVRCPVGCVATAMAQVMSVFRYPSTGEGSNSYTPYDVGELLTVNFGSTTYRWDNMLDEYDSTSPADAEEAVANLMYSLGVSINMQYTPTSSGGSLETAAVALVRNFKYDAGLQLYDRDYYEAERWINAIYGEFKAGRAVLYAGRNASVGHAFVLDGYRTGEYFHVNWGWGGISNGYFRLPSLNPAAQGVGGSAEGYNRGQSMLIGVRPEAGGSDDVIPRILMRGDLITADMVYDRSSSGNVVVRCNMGFLCQSVEPTDVHMGVRLVNKATGDTTYVMEPKKQSLSMNMGLVEYLLPISDFTEAGEFTVTPVFNTDGKWYDVLVRLDRSGEMNLIATDATLRFVPVDEDPDITLEKFNLESPVYSGKPVVLTASIHVEKRELLDEFYPVLIDLDDKVVARAERVEVNVPVGETVDYIWASNMSPSFTPGEYTVRLKSDSYGLLGTPIPVTVKATPTLPPVISGTVTINDGSKGDSSDNVAYVEAGGSVIHLSVKCTQGYYANPICVWIYYNDTRMIRGMGNKYVAIDTDQTYTRDISGWFGDLEHGHVYMIYPWALNVGKIGDPVYIQVGTSGIEEVEAENVGIWPNPASEMFRVTTGRDIAEVAVYSLSGALCGMYDGNGLRSMEVNVADLPQGLYIVKVAHADGTVKSYRLVKR